MAKTSRKKKDQDWIVSVLGQFEQPLIRYTYRFTQNVDQAREVVQDSFLKLCRGDRTVIEGHVREWLYTVCRNGALDLVRRNKPSVPMDDGIQDSSAVRNYVGAPETPSVIVERRIQTQRILTLIDELTDDQQEVIRLKFQDDLSYAEISKVTGHSVSNVGFLIHAGLKKARERLQKLREGSYGG